MQQEMGCQTGQKAYQVHVPMSITQSQQNQVVSKTLSTDQVMLHKFLSHNIWQHLNMIFLLV